jgi:ElaB/YqjD/DUF883 family membrane-anchored ribosome-binding protein
MSESSTRELMDDLRNVVADAEALLAATAHDASDRAREARSRTSDSLEQARKRLEDLESEIKARATAAADEADAFVRGNPWRAVGIAAAVGVLVGVLLGRR